MILSILVLIAIFFSGCSIKKKSDVEKEKNAANSESPKKETEIIDSDEDGLFDDEEEKAGTDKDLADTDGDGLSDFDELKTWKTDPLVKDTDNDGYDDGLEVQNGYDPTGLGQLDSDFDGIGDPEERKIGTDPYKFDTDGDGLNDKEEVDAGRDPLIEE